MVFFATVTAFIVLAAIATISGLYSARKSDDGDSWMADFMQGISTEMVGAIVTAIVFALLVGTVENFTNRQKLKDELIRNLASSDNGTALNAVERLRESGWLTDGTLEGANLIGANLHRADLTNANFKGADLSFADLSESKLYKTDFSNASLYNADLSYANLQLLRDTRGGQSEVVVMPLEALSGGIGWGEAVMLAALVGTEGVNASTSPGTIFIGADLYGANLQNANMALSDFRQANLVNADLSGTNLIFADLIDAEIAPQTIASIIATMPDIENVDERILYLEEMSAFMGPAPYLTSQTTMPDGRCWGEIEASLPAYLDAREISYINLENLQDFLIEPPYDPTRSCGPLTLPIEKIQEWLNVDPEPESRQ